MNTPLNEIKAINRLIQEETHRQETGFELIASENFTSPEVLEVVGSVLTNKYAEGYPGRRYYGGCHVVDEIERMARMSANKLFGTSYVNVQPHSGSNANLAVYLSTVREGDVILGLDLSHGGHLTHGAPVNFSGRWFRPEFYQTDEKSGTVDMNRVREKARKVNPKLISIGASAYSRDFDYKVFREIADEVGAVLWTDMAHTAGLIATGLLNSPFEYSDVVTTTTHKTLRGPRGGMILVGKDSENKLGEVDRRTGKLKTLTQLLDFNVFPGSQGGPLMHVIAGKAVAFQQALQPSFNEYQKQVLSNIRTLADTLTERGYKIVSGGTDNHLILVDLRNKGITGKDAETVLDQAGITVNKNMVPFDTESPFVTSGIRIGSPALTTRGFKTEEFKRIGELIDKVISSPTNEGLIDKVRKEVEETATQFPLFQQ